jgi:hypothetical protein
MAQERSAAPVFSHVLEQSFHDASRSKRDNYSAFTDTLTLWPMLRNRAGVIAVAGEVPLNMLAADRVAMGFAFAMQLRQDKWS